MKVLNRNFAYGAAALLFGAVGMASCSSEEELGASVNPTYDGKSVKTQFAINIPASGKQTRMSGDNTQQKTGSFLGMQNIKLLPLTTESVDGESALIQVISLGDIAATDGLDDQRKIYSDVNIPVGTKNFLFYGEADGTEDVATTTNAFEQGVLKNTIASSAKASDITFELLPVTTNNTEEVSSAASKKAVLDAVNAVAEAENNSWKDYAGKTENADKVLTKLYKQFTTCSAGSAASVKLLLADLKNQITELAAGTGSDENTIAAAIKSEIEAAIGTDGNGGTLAGNKFPQDFNLPDGAAKLSWNNGVASWVSDATDATVTVGDVSLDLKKVCYPASLSYFVSTGLKASNSSILVSEWPSYDEWKNGTWNDEVWTDTEVSATTQSIALTSPIQYGVALLQTSVKCKTPTLEDNAIAMGGEPQNRIITVPAETGFPVTGILIGGQPDEMMWNFKPASDENRTMTIYDNAVDEENVSACYNKTPTPNYTLVLENTRTEGDADKVNVAIELTNESGGDFYGVDGIIKNGATFYLVGQLDLTKLGDGGNANSRTSVFEQDYTTVATFTISSLKNAYNCIPDLRASKLQLGLAVDLEWKNGVVFDVTID